MVCRYEDIMPRWILIERFPVSFVLHFSQKMCTIGMERCLPLFAKIARKSPLSPSMVTGVWQKVQNAMV